MKAKAIKYTNVMECPAKGCKRGFYTDTWPLGRYECPEHHEPFRPIFVDEKGNKYAEVYVFAKELKHERI